MDNIIDGAEQDKSNYPLGEWNDKPLKRFTRFRNHDSVNEMFAHRALKALDEFQVQLITPYMKEYMETRTNDASNAMAKIMYDWTVVKVAYKLSRGDKYPIIFSYEVDCSGMAKWADMSS